jgi:hypothetical protein
VLAYIEGEDADLFNLLDGSAKDDRARRGNAAGRA